MDTLEKKELTLYAAAWGVVFALGPLIMLVHYLVGHDTHVAWGDILPVWLSILPFLVLFVLHNFLAAPFLIRKQIFPYLALTLAFLVVFGFYCFATGHRPPPEMGPGGERLAPPDGARPIEPETLSIVIGVLVVLVNLGIKAMFSALRSERAVQNLKEESLHRQLEALRYQINPHFFMNTLNNIHALVDVDPEKAKESIEEFSKLMRIVLYEGSSPTIPLEQEADYIRHYVSLMRLRYPESVIIDLALPESFGEAVVPPLLMASFVENAFKHGISYQEHSFVHVSLVRRKNQVYFKCANSRHREQPDGGRHGMGLENIRERMNLLYGARYTLNVVESDRVYEVLLILPEKC